MKLQFKFLILSIVFVFASCDSDDDGNPVVPRGDYELGFFVVNEGGFNDLGTISYVSNDFETVEQDIFGGVNTNQDLGLFPQSIFFDGDHAYIISNGSNLITVVNRYTFEKLGEFTAGLDVPRYGVVVDGKAYVTNQASFDSTEDDFVAVIDLENLSLQTIIPIMDVVEFIIYDGFRLYVQNASFGSGSGITIINPNSNEIEETVATGNGLQNIAINVNSIYAMHATGVDIISTNTQEVVSTIAMPSEITGARNLRIFNGELFYTLNNSAYKTLITASTLSTTPFLTYQSPSFGTMYGFAVRNGLVYIGDAADFASDGFIEVYDTDGNFVFESPVGLNPNGFYFN